MAYNMKNSGLKMSAKSRSPMQKNYAGSPFKQGKLGLVKKGLEVTGKVYSKVKKAYAKYKKGKPLSTSTEINPGGGVDKKTVTYKKSTDRTFYNADGSVNRTSSMPNK
tara:strand:+ start:59 stop:382 length:324 start_codon:yes stop_codon:yes gene_type:complete